MLMHFQTIRKQGISGPVITLFLSTSIYFLFLLIENRDHRYL
ncbi:hypothetical protein OIU76_012944 [Salix suchowensis]|nr:hypothetical protein OIU76_012944 [Salix suchowensis]